MSQQKQIALFDNEIQGFVNGQSASVVLGQKDFISYAPSASQDGVQDPSQVLFDSSGNMWVVDFANYSVIEFKPPFSSGMSASLVIGQKDLPGASAGTGFGGLGFRFPPLPDGTHIGGDVGDPAAASFDPSGNLWVADAGNDRILEFKSPFTNGMNASLVIGQKDFTSRLNLDPVSRLAHPTQPVFDSSGDLWVMDGGEDRVLEFRPPFSNGMGASLVIGQGNFTGIGTSSTQNGLNCYYGSLAIDPSGNLWVGDDGNNRILEFKPPFVSGMAASIVIGQPNFTARVQTAEGYATNLGFNVVFDSAGDLWASFNHRLLEYRPPFTSDMLPSLEIGQPDFTSVVWGGGQSGLSVFLGLPGFDSSGNLWVPDSGNNRVLEFASANAKTSSNIVQTTQPPGNLQPVEVGFAVLALVASSVVVLSRRTHHGNRG